jgi:hypothetical protein
MITENAVTSAPVVAKPELVTKLMLGKEDILAAVGQIQIAGKKLDTMIQVAGMSVLNHIDLHGDITLFEALWAAMPKGSRKKALGDWAVKYGKVVMHLDEKGKIVAEKPFLFNKLGRTNLLGAEGEPWFDCAPEKLEDTELDFTKLLGMLLAKADKASQKGIDIKGAELLKKVREAAAVTV